MQAEAFSPFLDKFTMALTLLLIPGFSDFESYIFNTRQEAAAEDTVGNIRYECLWNT